MKLGLQLGYWQAQMPTHHGDLVQAADESGFDAIFTAEAWGSDAFTPLAWWGRETSNVRLGTSIVQMSGRTPTSIAMHALTLDHLSGGRVEIGAGFGWNTDELADHHVPAEKRRTVLREYVEAMRALWTQEEASYDGEFVRFGPSWAYPKPAAHIPLIIGAGGGPKTFKWISENADGWMTTPTQKDISGQIDHLKAAWAEAGREGMPDIRVLIAFKPDPDDLMRWAEQGVSEFIWGVPDKSPDEVLGSLDRMAARLGIQPPALIG